MPICRTCTLLILFLEYAVRVGHARSGGAPTCFSMVPSHGVSSQSTPLPYSLQLSKSTYSAGEVIQSECHNYIIRLCLCTLGNL